LVLDNGPQRRGFVLLGISIPSAQSLNPVLKINLFYFKIINWNGRTNYCLLITTADCNNIGPAWQQATEC
jgi:hypothetical protein